MNGLSALTCHSCGLIQGVEDRPGAKNVCVCVCVVVEMWVSRRHVC